jgi:hypothetical protein
MAHFWPWQKVRHYDCPDGTRAVYRDLDDALPLYLSDHKQKTTAALKVAHELEAKVDAQHEERIKSLLFKLNSYNASNQQHLRAAYLIYSAAPCEKLDYFIEAVQEVREFEARLTQAEFLMQNILTIISKPNALKALQPNGGEVEDKLSFMITNVIEILARPSYVGRMINEIKQIQARTEDWRRG